MIVKFLKVAKITVSTLLYFFVSVLFGWYIVEHYIYDYTALYYAMWLSFGVLCGLFSYNTGGKIAAGKPETGPAANQTKSMDWTKRKDSHRIGLLVLGIIAVVLAALSFSSWSWAGEAAPTSAATFKFPRAARSASHSSPPSSLARFTPTTF
jgi:hypothetical protein